MGYAVELYFDPHTEGEIRKIRRSLIERGILSTCETLGDRPHVSLACFSHADAPALLALVGEFAAQKPSFEVRMGAIGAFPTDENVLFLIPALTDRLLTFHREFHSALAAAGLDPLPYYVPDVWQPHCTVELEIPSAQFAAALEGCKKAFKPLCGCFEEIGVIEYRPVRLLAAWPLVKA